ncbi:cell division protein ZapA [bacterium]|nr:cell division protein ZapA [bacterium]
MSSDKNVLTVRIFGAEYAVRGYADANYIKAIADYVDEKMREVDQSLRVDSSLKIAILASLNIAHELFNERIEKQQLQKKLEDNISRLNQIIDKKMTDSPE